MHFQRLTFRNRQGQRLAARIDWPEGSSPVAFVLFAHCFTCTKNLNAMVHISRALTAARLAVLRFDFTGLGESEGDFAETNFSSNVADLIDAAGFMAEQFQPPRLLIGHSLGGAAVLRAAAAIRSAAAVATIGAPADTTHLLRLFSAQQSLIDREGEATVRLAGRPFRIKKQFLEDLNRTHMEGALRGFDRPLLLLHSPDDQVVDIANAERIFRLAPYPKSLVSLDGADHLLTDRRNAAQVGVLLAAWARKYLDSDAESPAEVREANPGVRARTGAIGYRTEISAAGHRLLADEPIAVGGSDTGPTPLQLLAAALAACTAITLRMYADRKHWPLQSVEVTVEQARAPEDCPECRGSSGGSGRQNIFQREVHLEGPLTAEQSARLLDIANRCPVHRSLQEGAPVRSRLV